jgi:hypothetical protein
MKRAWRAYRSGGNGGLLPQAIIVLLILDFGIVGGQDANLVFTLMIRCANSAVARRKGWWICKGVRPKPQWVGTPSDWAVNNTASSLSSQTRRKFKFPSKYQRRHYGSSRFLEAAMSPPLKSSCHVLT